MPVNIQKSKSDQLSKSVPQVKVTNGQKNVLTTEEVQTVDEFVALSKAMEAVSVTVNGKEMSLKAAMKMAEESKKILAQVAMDAKRFPLDKPAFLVGSQGLGVEFTEQSHPRAITNMDGLVQKMKTKLGGYDKLLPFLKFTLKDVDSVLSKAEQQGLIDTTDGSRTCNGVKKA